MRSSIRSRRERNIGSTNNKVIPLNVETKTSDGSTKPVCARKASNGTARKSFLPLSSEDNLLESCNTSQLFDCQLQQKQEIHKRREQRSQRRNVSPRSYSPERMKGLKNHKKQPKNNPKVYSEIERTTHPKDIQDAESKDNLDSLFAEYQRKQVSFQLNTPCHKNTKNSRKLPRLKLHQKFSFLNPTRLRQALTPTVALLRYSKKIDQDVDDEEEVGSVVDALDDSVSNYSISSFQAFPIEEDDDKPTPLKSAFNNKNSDDDNETQLTRLSRIDQSTVKRLKRYIDRGDFFSHNKKYEQSIDAYMSALKLIKAAQYFSSTTERKVVNRLNDVHHTQNTISESSKIMQMGINCENSGQVIRALKYYTVCFRLRRAALGENHISLVIVLNVLADVQAKRQEYNEALKLYKMAIAILQVSNPKGRDVSATLPKVCHQDLHLFLPPCMSVLLRGLGETFEHTGNTSEALEFYHKSLKISVQLKKNHSSGCESPTGVADLSQESYSPASSDNMHMNNIDNSFEVSYEDPASYNMKLGKDDMDVAMTLHNIGHVHRRLGNQNLSLNAYKGALRGMRASLGDNHPNVAAIMGNIGNLYKEMGKYEMAMKIYNRVLQSEISSFGEAHAEVAVTMHNMGTIEYCRKKYESAVSYFTRALRIQHSIYGQDHLIVAATSNSLGETCEKMGDVEMVLKAYRNTLRIFTLNLGKDHLDAGKMLHKIGNTYHRLVGDYATSMKYYDKALAIFKSNSMTEEHPLVKQIIRDTADMTAAIQLQVEI